MPDPYYNVTLFFLSRLPQAGALLVSESLPPDTVHWLPMSLADFTINDEDIGKRVDLRVSGWWLKREGLEHLTTWEAGGDK